MIFDDSLVIPVLGTLPTPASGYIVIAFKSDGYLYCKNSSGVERQITGGYFVLAKTFSDTPYTITQITGELYLKIDASGGNVVINMPTAVGNTAKYNIKKTDSSANTVTIDGNSTETIDGSLTAVISVPNTSLTLVSDNANFQII